VPEEESRKLQGWVLKKSSIVTHCPCESTSPTESAEKRNASAVGIASCTGQRRSRRATPRRIPKVVKAYSCQEWRKHYLQRVIANNLDRRVAGRHGLSAHEKQCVFPAHRANTRDLSLMAECVCSGTDTVDVVSDAISGTTSQPSLGAVGTAVIGQTETLLLPDHGILERCGRACSRVSPLPSDKSTFEALSNADPGAAHGQVRG
jgi:hypothetical protein